MPHGVGAGGQPALVEDIRNQLRGRGDHRLGGGLGALALHETGDLSIEIKLWPIDLEVDGVGMRLVKIFFRHPSAVRPPFREVDHRSLVRRR